MELADLPATLASQPAPRAADPPSVSPAAVHDAPSQAPPADKPKKKRRTPEERARDEALKKAARARQKHAATFTTAEHALRHVTVVLDGRLMETEVGLAIGSEWRKPRGWEEGVFGVLAKSFQYSFI